MHFGRQVSPGKLIDANRLLHQGTVNHDPSVIDFLIQMVLMQMLVQTGVISDRYLQEGRLNTFLENVRQTVEHRHYYFGHMHIDKRLFRNQTALYYDVYRLADGRKAMRRDGVDELQQEAEWGETSGGEVL